MLFKQEFFNLSKCQILDFKLKKKKTSFNLIAN